MMSKSSEEVLNRAVQHAYELGHEYFTLEHVLLSLLDQNKITEIIEACGGSVSDIRTELENYIRKEVPKSN